MSLPCVDGLLHALEHRRWSARAVAKRFLVKPAHGRGPTGPSRTGGCGPVPPPSGRPPERGNPSSPQNQLSTEAGQLPKGSSRSGGSSSVGGARRTRERPVRAVGRADNRSSCPGFPVGVAGSGPRDRTHRPRACLGTTVFVRWRAASAKPRAPPHLQAPCSLRLGPRGSNGVGPFYWWPDRPSVLARRDAQEPMAEGS